MDAKQKKKFIKDLTAAVRDNLLAKVKDMPEEWDGHELRQLLADKFAYETTDTMKKGRRLRDYRNVVATTPL
jgi:hypothetical protein